MTATRRNLLGLCMIIRDEAHGIVETLRSFLPHVDRWTILDTGSTDGTQAVVRLVLDGVPGVLHEEPFVDFATSRNRALALHGEDTTFTIMPDSDDRLVGGVALRDFLVARESDSHPSYPVRLRRGDLSYLLPLVLRAASVWRYRGVVHEHVGPISGSGILISDVHRSEIPGVTITQDQGPRSLEASRRRWVTDLALIRAELERSPGDPRMLFYLGQTHECLGQHDQALAAYERRIQAGDWSEEVFESRLRRARVMGKLGRPWSDVQRAYMEAMNADPARAEPLVRIAEHWHGLDDHASTYFFARLAAALPRPARELFIDEGDYEFRAADLAAISGYYLGGEPRVEGARLARRAVRARPDDERMRANWSFYAPSARDAFRSYRSEPIAFLPEPPYVAYNPSIHLDGAVLRCVVRTSNYRVIDGRYVPAEGNVIWTRNFMLELDDSLRIVRSVEMVDRSDHPRSTYQIRGFEDCRLFRFRGRLCCTATACDVDPDRAAEGPREMVLLELSEDDYRITRATPLRGAWSDRPQKNWMPLLDDDDAMDLRLVYAASPDGGRRASVLRLSGEVVDDGLGGTTLGGARVDPLGSPSLAHGRLRGGSQLVRVPEGWLGITHDVCWPGGNSRIYLHRFVLFSANLEIISITDPFYFERRGVEFCVGLARDGERLIASFGVEDCHAYLATIGLACVRRALREDLVI